MVELIGGDFHGNILHNFESVGLQSDALHGVVRDQAHLCHTECTQNLCPHAIIALIGVVSEVNIGVHGVKSLLLELIGGDFRHQTDAAALLVEVKHETFAFFIDQLHGLVELVATIATTAAKNVAGHATTVHSHEDRFARLPRSFEKRHVFETVALLSERNQVEIAVIGGHLHLFSALHERFLLESVSNQVLDRDNLEAFARRELF